MIKKIYSSDKGFTLVSMLIIFLIASVASYALIVNQGQHLMTTIKSNSLDKAFFLADAGVQTAIGWLRQNAEFERTPNDNNTDALPRELNGKGEIVVTVQQTSMEEYGQVAVIISSGMYHEGNRTNIKVIRAVVKVDNPGNYFCASSTKLTIGSDSDMSQGGGIIYGDILEFKPGAGPLPFSKIYQAEYHSSRIPSDEPTLVYDPPTTFGYAQFTICPSSGPQQVPIKVLPVISIGLLTEYYKFAQTNPSSFLPNTITSINPYNSTLTNPNNGSNVWYFPEGDPATTPGHLYIERMQYDLDRSCIVVVNGNLYIRGNISKLDPNSEYTLAFIVKGNVFIDIAACVDDPLILESVLFIATNGRFGVINVDAPKNELQFSGGVLIKKSLDLKAGFDARTYAYDPKVKEIDNLPFMVYILEYD